MAKPKTQIPADPEDLICSTCPTRYADRGNIIRTYESARAAGWHIYTPEQGEPKYLCPACIGTPRSREPVPQVLPGQADILSDLGVTLDPKPKPRRPRREMS